MVPGLRRSKSDRFTASSSSKRSPRAESGRTPKVFINPVIEQLSPDTDVRDEGCLSFPGIFISVKRSLKAKVSALDLDDGKPFSVDAEFFARAIQHEYDRGQTLLYDHAGPIKSR